MWPAYSSMWPPPPGHFHQMAPSQPPAPQAPASGWPEGQAAADAVYQQAADAASSSSQAQQAGWYYPQGGAQYTNTSLWSGVQQQQQQHQGSAYAVSECPPTGEYPPYGVKGWERFDPGLNAGEVAAQAPQPPPPAPPPPPPCVPPPPLPEEPGTDAQHGHPPPPPPPPPESTSGYPSSSAPLPGGVQSVGGQYWDPTRASQPWQSVASQGPQCHETQESWMEGHGLAAAQDARGRDVAGLGVGQLPQGYYGSMQTGGLANWHQDANQVQQSACPSGYAGPSVYPTDAAMAGWQQAMSVGHQNANAVDPCQLGAVYTVPGVAPQGYQAPKVPVPVTKVKIKTLLQKMAQAGRKPKKVAAILRGLPGSGKTEIARKLKEQALACGLEAPRIHSIDDYFMTEVETVVPAPESGRKGKQRKIMELQYVYEPEMKEVYQQSLIKAFCRTADEGRFSFIILDAPNIRNAEFKDCLAAGQRAGYEVHILQPLETDVKVCHKRNIHGVELEVVERMAAEWEAPPPVYAQLDVSALFTDAEGGIIREVEMEEDSDGETSSNRDAQRKLPRKSKGGSEPEAVVSVSRWERMDDADAEDDPSDNKRLKTSVSKGPSTDGKAGDRNHSSCELHDAIRRAHKKQVRWADEEEEVEGFHIGGIRRQLEDVHYIDDLGEELDDAEVEATRQGDSASRSCDVTTFAQRVKAEHTAFRSMHLKGVLKSSAKAPS